MTDEQPVTMGEIALAEMAKATDAQKIALAIQMVIDVTDPGQAQSLLRLATLVKVTGDELSKRRFEEETR